MAHPCSRKAMVENLKRKLWGNTDISFKKDPFELDNLYYIKSVQCALQKWSPATKGFAKKTFTLSSTSWAKSFRTPQLRLVLS